MSVAGCRGLTIRLLESAVWGPLTRNTMCHGDSWVRGCWLGRVGSYGRTVCSRGCSAHVSEGSAACLHLSVRGHGCVWLCGLVYSRAIPARECCFTICLVQHMVCIHAAAQAPAGWWWVWVGSDVQAHLAFVAVQQLAHRCRPACSFGASCYILGVLLLLASHTKAVYVCCVCWISTSPCVCQRCICLSAVHAVHARCCFAAPW
jgi:hypothetical protein